MKVWFFKETWKSSSGWKNAYYAVTAQGCHMTSGSTLAEAIYMAHDLIACVKEDGDDEKIYDEPFDYLNDGIFNTDSRNFFIGSFDIDVDVEVFYKGWVRGWKRAGDKSPNTKHHMRVEMLWRAFRLTYRNFKLGGVTKNSK